MRRALGFLFGLLVRAWLRTLSVRVVALGPLPNLAVFAFCHGQQMALLRSRPKGLRVLVSHSADGDLQTGVMRALGVAAARGSSSSGGGGGLRALVRAVRRGSPIAFAVDGPRGPAGKPKAGALVASKMTGVPLVVAASAASRRVVLGRAWDRFEIPLPFSRVVVVAKPLRKAAGLLELERALDDARERALSELARAGEPWHTRERMGRTAR